MSWDIFVYGEYRNHNTPEWFPISTEPLHDSFKYRMLRDINDLDIADPKTIHKSLYHPLMLDSLYNRTIHSICLKDFNFEIDEVINKFKHTMILVYKALGVSLNDLDDIDNVESLYCDLCDNTEAVSLLTHPVSKELMELFLQDIKVYNKAIYLRGFCDTVANMTPNYNDEIRLLFITT